MTPLPPEIEKQISDRADELTLSMPIDNDYQVGYVQGFIAGHDAGAKEWAGRAQGLVDALEKINEKVRHWDDDRGRRIIEQITYPALAKYKEVGNG